MIRKVFFTLTMVILSIFLVSCAQNLELEQEQEQETSDEISSEDNTPQNITTIETAYVPSRTIKIACVGDSLTYGVGATDRTSKSYPSKLQSLLGDSYEVKNFGRSRAFMIDKSEYSDFTYSSDKSVAYKSTSEYRSSIQYDANIVLICLGTNDAHASNKNADVDQKTFFYESAVALAKEYQNLPSKPKDIFNLSAKPF